MFCPVQVRLARFVFGNSRAACGRFALVLLLVAISAPALHAEDASVRHVLPAQQAVTRMVKNEITDYRSQETSHAFRFLTVERSARTGGQLWTEEEIEVDGGLLRRLVAINGKPLSPKQAAAEQRRLEQLAAHPTEFAEANRSRDKDLARVERVLKRMPREFLFQNEGEQNGCERISFRPNPAYQPISFEDRVVHNMAGTIDIKEPAMRLCSVQGRLINTVNFGFGLLGHLSKGGGFSLRRTQLEPAVWRITHLKLHFAGTLFFFKSISRDQKTVRSHFQPVPPHLTLHQAVALSRPSVRP